MPQVCWQMLAVNYILVNQNNDARSLWVTWASSQAGEGIVPKGYKSKYTFYVPVSNLI